MKNRIKALVAFVTVAAFLLAVTGCTTGKGGKRPWKDDGRRVQQSFK